MNKEYEQNKQAQPDEAVPAGWTCAACGESNTGKYCTECGKQNPVVNSDVTTRGSLTSSSSNEATNYTGGFTSGIIDLINGYAQKQERQDDSDARIVGFHVDDDMRHYFLWDRDEAGRLAIATVEKVLVSNECWTYLTYPCFRIGNMAFFRIQPVPAMETKDLDMFPEFVVVILGIEPRLVHMPDKELFAKFMNAVRADPNLMKPDRRLSAALILATGDDRYIDSRIEDGIDPTWTDEDGVLVIHFHRYTGNVNFRSARKRVAYTLIVDDNQNYILEEQVFA